jgi:LAS superfamily LD-carboxypeptidase LdcB
MYFLSNLANEIGYYQVGLTIKYALNIVFTIIPIIVMIMCMVDISKHITKPDAPGPTIKMIVTRIIAGLIIFLLPTMFDAVFSLIEGYDNSFITKYYTEASVEKIEQLKVDVENERVANLNKSKAELKEAANKKAEEERKRNEQIEEQRKENEQNNSGGNYSGDSVSSGEYGSVKVENGVFYLPNRRATSDSDIPKQSGGYGLNPIFWERLNALLTDASAKGYNVTVTSGWRSYSSQRSLWDNSNRACSERGKWVACPGGSRHGFGIAADLSFNGTSCSGGWDCNEAAKWVHANAANYGLKFRMSWEPWHIEPENVQGGSFGSCNVSC